MSARKAADGFESDWIRIAIWGGLGYVFFMYLAPSSDRLLAHPWLSVAAIGAISFLMFSGAAIWDWRYGEDLLGLVQARIAAARPEPDGPEIGLWIILGVTVLVILGVVIFAIAEAPQAPGNRGVPILILGGLTAGVAAPFLILPAIPLAGLFAPRRALTIRFAVRLADPPADAAWRRAAFFSAPGRRASPGWCRGSRPRSLPGCWRPGRI